LREDIIETKDKTAVEEIIEGLAGLDSDMAWKMRERLTAEAEDKNGITRAVLCGLAGVDSDKAWQLRDKYLSNSDYFSAIEISLSGLSSDRARKMREKLVKEEKYEESVMRRIYGGIEMVGVRKARHDKIKNKNRK
jgi:ERCC4-type nuclease